MYIDEIIHNCMIIPNLVGYQYHLLFVDLDQINILIIRKPYFIQTI